jgi:thiamine biosynthesis protein ThiS
VLVQANGRPVELASGATVADLLATLGLTGSWVVVERNGQPVPRGEVGTTSLDDGDRLEVVRAVAGG